MLLVKLINKVQEMKSHYETFNQTEARDFMKSHSQSDYTLLDVREDWEYEESHIPGSYHIPLSDLAERYKEVDVQKPVIAYCRAGGRSAAAASLLKGQGYGDVYNLMGGIGQWENEQAVGPATAGMLYFTGNESIEEIVAMACRMEVNLGEFYKTMAAKAEDADVTATLEKLANFEEKHRNWLLIIYKQMTGEELSEEFLTASLSEHSDVPLEGGLTADEFIEMNAPFLDEPIDIVEMGMMFEAQALDVYMRYAAKAESDESRDLLLKLADEEKAHLKALSNLLTKMGG